MMYVVFNTIEDAQTALDADNLALGYPNGFGTFNAWQWVEMGSKFVVIDLGLPEGSLVGFQRLTEQDMIDLGLL